MYSKKNRYIKKLVKKQTKKNRFSKKQTKNKLSKKQTKKKNNLKYKGGSSQITIPELCYSFFKNIYIKIRNYIQEIREVENCDINNLLRFLNIKMYTDVANKCLFDNQRVPESIRLTPINMSDGLYVYDKSLMNLKQLSREQLNRDLLNVYIEMYKLNEMNQETPEMNQEIAYYNQQIQENIISIIDIENQINFYNKLNSFSKKIFLLQKNTPDYVKVYRENGKNFLHKTKIITDNQISTNNMNTIENMVTINQELEYSNSTGVLDKPTIRCLNVLRNIFYYIPPIEKYFYVYRVEKIWENIETLNDNFTLQGSSEYIFTGLTSTSCDPRLAFSFNKLQHISDDELVIFRILIPRGSRVIVPSVRENDFNDSEFEITLFDRAKIKISNIDENKNYKYLVSPTNEEYSNEIKTRRIKYYIDAKFTGYLL